MSDGAYSTGGAAGNYALTHDLAWAVHVLHDAAADVRAAAAAIARRRVAWELAPPAALPPPAVHALDARLANVGHVAAARLEDDLDDAARRLSAVVSAFVSAERSARRGFGAVGRVGEAMWDVERDRVWVARGVGALVWRLSPPGLIASALGADPIGGALAPDGPPPTTGYANRDSVEAGLALVPAYGRIAALLDAQARAIEFIAREPQSRGVTARPAATAAPAPRSLAAMIRELKRVEEGGDGSVRIDAWTGVDGVTRRVVYIPGTEDWGVWSGNPADAEANLALMAGRLPGAARTVVDALATSGATPRDPVLLVGHSQGGMVAAALAASPAIAARFHIEGIVTAGSPVGRIALPRTVSALHLEGTRDVVPGLDGRPNPDTPERTTVHHDTRRSGLPALDGAGESVASAHALATYAETAALVDEGLTASTDAWLERARDFLEPGSDATATDYVP